MVPGLVVIPHFDTVERWVPGLVERQHSGLEPGQVLVGIDEDTALVGGPRRFVVRGRSRVWLVDGDGRRPHRPGETVEFAGSASSRAAPWPRGVRGTP